MDGFRAGGGNTRVWDLVGGGGRCQGCEGDGGIRSLGEIAGMVAFACVNFVGFIFFWYGVVVC